MDLEETKKKMNKLKTKPNFEQELKSKCVSRLISLFIHAAYIY